MNEKWRDVPGHEGVYQVSNMGRLKRITEGRGPYGKPRIIKLTAKKGRYLNAKLQKDSKKIRVGLHRLVAAAFLGICPDGMEVNHKNGNKQDNRVDNLEYVTRAENIYHATYVIKTRPILSGENAPGVKLTDRQAKDIINLYDTGEYFQAELANRYGVSQPCISYIVNGKRKLANGNIAEAN